MRRSPRQAVEKFTRDIHGGQGDTIPVTTLTTDTL